MTAQIISACDEVVGKLSPFLGCMKVWNFGYFVENQVPFLSLFTIRPNDCYLIHKIQFSGSCQNCTLCSYDVIFFAIQLLSIYKY